MASLESKLTITLGAVSVVYAFWCQIRTERIARRIRDWILRELPEPWSELNPIARTWGGGQAGIKLLLRRGRIQHPEFAAQYGELQAMERRMLAGIGAATLFLGLAIAGKLWWGWVF